MPFDPSRSMHFDSWESVQKWLPEADERELLTAFVWAGDLQAPGGDARRLAQVRQQAFERLVQKTIGRLRDFLLRRCGCRDVHLAEDVAQQVLIKVYLRAEQYDPKRSFWGWLYRIARNEYIDSLRRLKPGDIGLGQVGQDDAELEQWLENLGSTGPAPEQDLLDRECRDKVQAVLAALPRLQRSIVERKLAGAKGKEIARELNISQAYVSQLFHEAAEILREAVES